MKLTVGLGAFLAVVGSAVGVANAPQRRLAANATADRVVVEKATRQLTLLKNGVKLKTYRIALGRQPVGDKVQQGDNRTPEGTFFVDRRNAKSQFHRALHLSYPDTPHIARAKALGVDPGGDIMVHGIRNGLGWIGSLHRTFDWTAGCIAVTNREIEEIWRAVPDRTPVEIRP